MPTPTPSYNPLFDTYFPVPPLVCPECGLLMSEGQGTDGPSMLLDWRQGSAEPVDQRVEEQSENWRSQRLPATFDFMLWCPQDHSAAAEGTTVDGVWSRTTLVPPSRDIRRR